MVPKKPGQMNYEYVRDALKNGLKVEQEVGANSFKYGLAGGTDTHNGLASHFGGTRNGTIVHWPAGVKADKWMETRPQVENVLDDGRKIHALYRAWRRSGDTVLWQSCSTCLRDGRAYGRSAVEVQWLNRQYLQLTGTMDRDVWAKRGAQRKSRQVGPPVSTPSLDTPSALVAP
jgi:hypothetical protein